MISVSLSRQTRPSVYHFLLDMSALQVFVVAIAALCLSTAEFAISAVLLWGKRTDLSHRWQLLFQPVLSAVLIILATLLFLYTGNEAAVPILLVSVISVGGICQVSQTQIIKK